MSLDELEEGLRNSIAERGYGGKDGGSVRDTSLDKDREKFLSICLEKPELSPLVEKLQRAVANKMALSEDLLQSVTAEFGFENPKGVRRPYKRKEKTPVYGFDLTLSGAVEQGLLPKKLASVFPSDIETLKEARASLADTDFVQSVASTDEATLGDVKPYLEDIVYLALRELYPAKMPVQNLLDAQGNGSTKEQKGFARLFEQAVGLPIDEVSEEIEDSLNSLRLDKLATVSYLANSVDAAVQTFMSDIATGKDARYGSSIVRPELKR